MALMQRTSVTKVVSHQISKVLNEVGGELCMAYGVSWSFSFNVALDILVKAIEKAGYTGKIKIGMDVAASEFYDEKETKYDLNNKEKGKPNYVNIRVE